MSRIRRFTSSSSLFSLHGKVAVITGAASGMGSEYARHCARNGMKLVLSDIEKPALKQLTTELKDQGTEVLSLEVDVSKHEQMTKLASQTYEKYGKVHLLFNNAGVRGIDYFSDIKVWDWMIGINLYGVLYGIQVFVPKMIAQNERCHVINTASIAGLANWMNAYSVTKQAVVALSETLHYELANRKSQVRVHCLCPSFVNTQFSNSHRNAPTEIATHLRGGVVDDSELGKIKREAIRDVWNEYFSNGESATKICESVFESIQKDQFWIFPWGKDEETWKKALTVNHERRIQRLPPIVPAPVGEVSNKVATEINKRLGKSNK